MRTAYEFIEGYAGNDTVRGWKKYDSIYHSVFACMRGTPGYPKGQAQQVVPTGLLLRPAIPSPEIFGVSNTYGPMANFKISLRELPTFSRAARWKRMGATDISSSCTLLRKHSVTARRVCCEIDDGASIPAETARRLACDCERRGDCRGREWRSAQCWTQDTHDLEHRYADFSMRVIRVSIPGLFE